MLREDIDRLRALGVDTLVSQLEPAEERELLLEREAEVCAAAGVGFLRLPVPDRGLPEPEPFAALVREIVARVRQGGGVSLHCRAGIGRSGMVACCVLAGFGLTVEDAVATVSRARGVDVPDTPAQHAFIERMARPGSPAVR